MKARVRIGMAIHRLGLLITGVTTGGKASFPVASVWIAEESLPEESWVFGVYTGVDEAVRAIKEAYLGNNYLDSAGGGGRE